MSLNSQILENPGPMDYIPDVSSTKIEKEGGERKPFGVNKIRFEKHGNGVPGAGTYKLPDSCQVRAPKQTLASYRSTVDKGLNNIVIGKDNPGIGEYDTQQYKTISNKEFQGGAANNFVLFTRQNY